MVDTISRQQPHTTDRCAPRVGEHAIVIGASMAGLLAARVLSDSYDRVTVLDRDTLPDGSPTIAARFRRGVTRTAFSSAARRRWSACCPASATRRTPVAHRRSTWPARCASASAGAC